MKGLRTFLGTSESGANAKALIPTIWVKDVLKVMYRIFQRAVIE